MLTTMTNSKTKFGHSNKYYILMTISAVMVLVSLVLYGSQFWMSAVMVLVSLVLYGSQFWMSAVMVLVSLVLSLSSG